MSRLIVFILSALASLFGAANTDPSTWFGSTAALAPIVVAAVAFLRKSLAVDGILAVVLSVAVGAGLAAGGFAADLFGAGVTLFEALTLGIGAGWAASAGYDGVKALSGKVAGQGA